MKYLSSTEKTEVAEITTAIPEALRKNVIEKQFAPTSDPVAA